MNPSLPAIDLFSAPEAPRPGSGRDRNAGHDGSPFALELEKARPASDRGTNAQAAESDAAATQAQERASAAKRQENEERETNAKRANDAKRAERSESTEAEPDEDGVRVSDELPQDSSAGSSAVRETPSADAPETVDATPNPSTTETIAREPPRLPTQLDLEALLRIATEAAVDPESKSAANPTAASTPTVPVPDARAAASGTLAAAARSATASVAPAAASADAATQSADSAAATAQDAGDATRPRRDGDERTTRSAPMPTASYRDEHALSDSATVDFSGLDDGTDVRALLAQHAAQQRKVAAVGTADQAFGRTESTRAATQEVVTERAEHEAASDSARRSPNDGETRDASTPAESRARGAETASVTHSTSSSPALPQRGAESGMREPNVVNASSTAQAIARGPAAPATSAPAAMPHAVPIQAILAQVRSQVRGGAHAINLRLDPAELGRLTLRFRMDGDQLHVSVRASRPEVVEALRADLSAFADTLRDAGIDLTGLDIDLAAPRDGDSTPAFADLLGESGSQGGSHRDPELTTVDPAEPSRSRVHDGLVDILA
ncbi:MAG: flagellar hook-length control protein FliK [Planctomycetes bacterium]|nr:flagellar hook-length control protein FliK [Planctomycetota bacterium]MCC7169069.1 flagellar hook-length control protein FliK [Planctomycetota bacterium]